jgi:hypothetical protein
MRSSISKIWIVLALSGSCWAAGCGDDSGGSVDGGGAGGAGPSGGAGGSGAITDAGGGGTGGGIVGCLTEAPVACPDPPVRYGDVQATFQGRCVGVCHNGTTPDPNKNNEPIWGFTDYEHVVSWQDTIRAEVLRCSMPPADAGVPMTVEERRAILEFLRCGLPK